MSSAVIETTAEAAAAPAAPPETGAAAEAQRAWCLDDDTLAQALAWLTMHHGHERSVHALLAGQPVTGPLDPMLAVRVMSEAG